LFTGSPSGGPAFPPAGFPTQCRRSRGGENHSENLLPAHSWPPLPSQLLLPQTVGAANNRKIPGNGKRIKGIRIRNRVKKMRPVQIKGRSRRIRDRPLGTPPPVCRRFALAEVTYGSTSLLFRGGLGAESAFPRSHPRAGSPHPSGRRTSCVSFPRWR
jgi:hypothetical protein